MHNTWTDQHGTAHFTKNGRTLCGVLVEPTSTVAVDGCAGCVRASIRDYARRHDCTVSCHVVDPRPLDRRDPGAHLDRRLRWTGELFPAAYGCTDLALMQRVNAALIAQLADPDAARFRENTATDPTQD